MPPSSFAARRRHALEAAAELLEELGADQEQPVDVFGAIGSLGLWLVFQPLRSLLGAVIPNGSGGIMLTTERQPPVQRYTAGHEIGHWLLDQDRLACDTEDDIFRPAAERERVAQLFASYFLMPPPLAHAACARHGVWQNADVLPALPGTTRQRSEMKSVQDGTNRHREHRSDSRAADS
ncbi:MAG: ImmA/IrrE family metallo-endopeptidase [Streptosporangiaceae bacterium]